MIVTKTTKQQNKQQSNVSRAAFLMKSRRVKELFIFVTVSVVFSLLLVMGTARCSKEDDFGPPWRYPGFHPDFVESRQSQWYAAIPDFPPFCGKEMLWSLLPAGFRPFPPLSAQFPLLSLQSVSSSSLAIPALMAVSVETISKYWNCILLQVSGQEPDAAMASLALDVCSFNCCSVILYTIAYKCNVVCTYDTEFWLQLQSLPRNLLCVDNIFFSWYS